MGRERGQRRGNREMEKERELEGEGETNLTSFEPWRRHSLSDQLVYSVNCCSLQTLLRDGNSISVRI